MRLLITILIGGLLCSSCGQNENTIVWPNGAKSAISLTYDDGLSSHVNTVAPLLNKYGFKATFYPTASSPSLSEENEKWRQLTLNGHELGNHTVYHPCRKSESGMDWVKDEYDLDNYTIEQIAEEIRSANAILSEMDGSHLRTFAYPCSHSFAGGESYVDIVASIFPSARVSSEVQTELVKLPDLDLHKIPSWAPHNHEADQLISYIDKIIEHKTFSTLTFHGIGAEHMKVSQEAHEAMIRYLDSNRDKIWVGTVKENVEYLRSKRE